MNHEPEPPSWMPGAAAVGTGAGPPSEDEEAAEGRNAQVSRSNAGAGGEDDAPSFSDDLDTGWGELPADEPGFGAAGGPPGFGQAPASAPGFGVAPETDPFGAPHPADPGFVPPAEAAAAFEPGPRADFGSSYPSDYVGPYQGDGFAPPQGDGGFAPPQGGGSFAGGPAGPFGGPDGSFAAADAPYGARPAAGVLYGTAAAGAGYMAGQENGAALHDPAPPLPGQYPPSPVRQPRRPRVKPTLRSPWRRRRSRRAARGGRQAQLTLARLEPWSVMKFSFVISLVAFIVLFVAVAVLYAVLSGLGVFDALQRTIESITSGQSSSGFNLNHYVSASRVLGYTGLLGAINVVLITALSTVGAVLYNITADLAGGIEVTLKESD